MRECPSRDRRASPFPPCRTDAISPTCYAISVTLCLPSKYPFQILDALAGDIDTRLRQDDRNLQTECFCDVAWVRLSIPRQFDGQRRFLAHLRDNPAPDAPIAVATDDLGDAGFAGLEAGDVVAVRSGLLEMREKVAKFVHEMRHATTGELSAICVLTAVHMDSKARKSTAFPADMLARGRARLCSYDLGA